VNRAETNPENFFRLSQTSSGSARDSPRVTRRFGHDGSAGGSPKRFPAAVTAPAAAPSAGREELRGAPHGLNTVSPLGALLNTRGGPASPPAPRARGRSSAAAARWPRKPLRRRREPRIGRRCGCAAAAPAAPAACLLALCSPPTAAAWPTHVRSGAGRLHVTGSRERRRGSARPRLGPAGPPAAGAPGAPRGTPLLPGPISMGRALRPSEMGSRPKAERTARRGAAEAAAERRSARHRRGAER